MNIWIWSMLATSPIAFLISYCWEYRWAFYDSGGGSKLFWKMLRTDLHCSIPGQHGDLARITRCRGWIRKYGRMRADGIVTGINKPFREIWKQARYQEYEKFFMPPKWWIWAKMTACLIWPVTLVILLIVCVVVLVYNALFK